MYKYINVLLCICLISDFIINNYYFFTPLHTHAFFSIARELYPYQMKLASIDNLRVDGKFLDEDGSIPEGQGIIMALLNECYDILYELKADVEEDASD